MIKCRNCVTTKQGDPRNGGDMNSEGWKLLLAQDSDVGFIALCPKCKEQVEKLASEITKIVKAKYIYLYTMLPREEVDDNK
jgi:hypothetical protein